MLKISRIKINRRRLFLPLLGLIVPAMSALAPVLPASATANIQLKWLDNTHIQVTGSSIQQSAMITFNSSDGGKTLGYPAYVGLLTPVKLTYQGKSTTVSCYIPELVTFQNNTIGRGITLAADESPAGPSSGTGNGPQRCPSPTTSDAVGYHSDSTQFHQFDGNYTTTNDWPGSGGGTTPETAAQKIVSVSITSWLTNSPNTLPITLTPSGKSALPTVTSSTQVVKTGDASVNHAKSYTYTATIPNVPVGDFKVCAAFGGKTYCDTGTRKVYNPGSALIEMGSPPEGTDTKIVQITTEYDNPQLADPGVAQTFGPYNIDLKQGGKVIQTQTTSFKYTPSSECKNASTAACGTSLIQDIVYFNNIEPGQYQACMQGTTRCTSVFTKSSGEIAGFQNRIYLKLAAADITAADSGGSTNDATLDCGAGSWNWLICSGIQLLQGAAEKLDNFIMSQLDINTGKIFNNQNTAAYKTAWNSFRILATAVLIIGGLIMIASQALGFEFLDAYTIRKVLPRLLIAAIGISLSWPLLQFVINFFDVLGQDIRGLIYAPFDAMAKSGGVTGLVLLGNPLTLLVAGGALFVAFGPALFTFLLTAFIALLIAFLILTVRQIAVIVLVILAPLAIACYILPNTQKVWKIWMDNFLGLMLMFPIISALIAAGHVMSAVGRTGSTFEQFVSVVAYFIPYFMLPFAFRLATGAIGTIAGLVNDRGKGAFDRLKKVRGNAAAKNWNDIRGGQRFSERNAMTRSFNRTGAGVASGWKGRFGVGERGTQAVDQARRNAALNNVMKSPAWNAIQHDDDVLMAATYNNAAAARAGLMTKWNGDATRVDRAIAGAQSSIGYGRPQAIAAAQQLASTGTGYSNLQEASETIARASGGDVNSARSMAGFVNSETKRVGRFDMAPGYSTFAGLVENEIAGGGAAPSADDYHAASVRAVRGADAVTMLRGKPQQVENLVTSLAHHAASSQARAVDTSLSAADRATANDEFLQTMGQIDQINQQKSYASAENQELVNGLLNATAPLRGHLGDITGANVPVGPLTAEQTANRARYEQTRAPRLNPNDPNLPTTE